MMLKNVERTFEITKENQYFPSGNWQYYDSKENLEIIPRGKGLYNVKGKYESPLKMYCKAWSVEIECENIWREVMKFVKDSKIIC